MAAPRHHFVGGGHGRAEMDDAGWLISGLGGGVEIHQYIDSYTENEGRWQVAKSEFATCQRPKRRSDHEGLGTSDGRRTI